MKAVSSILCGLILHFSMVFPSNADTISYGKGRYVLAVNGGVEIDAEELESKWHRKARSLCKNTEYNYRLFPVSIRDDNRATLIIKDRRAKGVKTVQKSEIKLTGALLC